MNSARAKLPVNFELGKDLVFSGVKSDSTLDCRPYDSTSGIVNKMSVREKSRGVNLQ